MSFAHTRAKALNLEKETELLLAKYATALLGVELGDREAELEQQVSAILEEREVLVKSLASINAPPGKAQQVQRHREILAEHRQSFARMEEASAGERARHNLLYSVREDISAHHQRSKAMGAGSMNANDYALDESQRADAANSLADRLLNQAHLTRDDLEMQRQRLGNAQLRMLASIQQVPGLKMLVSKINSRRKRDTVILATLIALCIVVLVIW